MRRALAALMLALPSAAPASETMTAAESSAVQIALDRGQLLYAYDRAAWEATDAMIASAKASGQLEKVMATGGGYVIEGDTAAQTVTFFDRADPPQVMFRIRRGGASDKPLVTDFLGKGEPLSDNQLRLVRERAAIVAAASKQRIGFCAHARPNLTILPAAKGIGSDVAYLMTPQTAMGAWPMGGHYRFEVEDGKPGKARSFAKSCLSLSPPAAKDGAKPEAFVVSHLLDPTPTEIHVFTMLAARMPLYVMTTSNGKLWAIEASGGQARIRLLDRTAKGAGKP